MEGNPFCFQIYITFLEILRMPTFHKLTFGSISAIGVQGQGAGVSEGKTLIRLQFSSFNDSLQKALKFIMIFIYF